MNKKLTPNAQALLSTIEAHPESNGADLQAYLPDMLPQTRSFLLTKFRDLRYVTFEWKEIHTGVQARHYTITPVGHQTLTLTHAKASVT